MEKNEKMPIGCRIIVAQMIEERYSNSLKIMKTKPKKDVEYHLHIEGKEATARLDRLQKEKNEKWLDICKLFEANLAQALYHCLQCDNHAFVLHASEKIMAYILAMQTQRGLYEKEVQDIIDE
jgi:hypothetical protein